nr:MAG TPA: hypothetical protein [Caudoviricetes sp.]
MTDKFGQNSNLSLDRHWGTLSRVLSCVCHGVKCRVSQAGMRLASLSCPTYT